MSDRAARSEVSVPVRVLAVTSDPDIARAIAHVVREEGDEVTGVVTVEAALAAVEAATFDVALIEIHADGGGALALCHLLGTASPGIRVHAIVRGSELARGEEALSLGAAGVLVAPATGDAMARVLSDVKAEARRKAEVAQLEQKLARERKRVEIYDRLVRLARGASPADAARAIAEGVAHLSGALGVALYATAGAELTERVLLAATGSALDLPAKTPPAELSRLAQTRQARLVPLVVSADELGVLVLDRAPPSPEPEIAQLADLAAAMLSLVDDELEVDDPLRVLPSGQFGAVAERMLSLAARHDRRAAVVAVSLPPGEGPRRREEATVAISDIVRNTDALCGSDQGDLLVFLPETSGLGAHACRRRILARLSGERRARSRGGVPRGEPRSSGAALSGRIVSVGVGTFPHDGASLERLVAAARARATDDARSAVHALSLEALSFSEVVDTLIARPIFDAGPRSPYPIDVACAALFALVARACRESLRGGEVSVAATLQPGLGVAAAARQVTTPRVHDVRAEPGCANVEAIVVEAEHAAWVCCGRLVGDRFRGVHAADPLLADVVARHLSSSGTTHAG